MSIYLSNLKCRNLKAMIGWSRVRCLTGGRVITEAGGEDFGPRHWLLAGPDSLNGAPPGSAPPPPP